MDDGRISGLLFDIFYQLNRILGTGQTREPNPPNKRVNGSVKSVAYKACNSFPNNQRFLHTLGMAMLMRANLNRAVRPLLIEESDQRV
jgi:hypothetical protein